MNQLEELTAMFETGRLDRRDFLRRLGALGVTLGTAATLPSISHAARPRRGGRLRMGLSQGSNSDTLDPAHITDIFTQVWCAGSLRNGLTVVEPDGSLGPELAESWEPVGDASVWRFVLRKGVQFHNGKTMTPEDVTASLNHHRGEASKSAAKTVVEPIQQMRADGHAVIITLDKPNVDFPYLLSDVHLMIMPGADSGAAEWRSGIGTGPYVLEKFEPGIIAEASRNENYFKDNAAYFDSISILPVHDTTARTTALMTGEIDVMDRCDLKTVNLLQRRPGVEIVVAEGKQHYTLPMQVGSDPFTDNHVRLALKHGIDREAILETVLQGYGSVGNDQPINGAYRFFDANLEQRRYDPDKAAYHLKQAGLSSLEVNLSVADAAFPGAVDSGALFKEQAKDAGINISLVREPNDGYWQNVWRVKPFCACFWSGRTTTDLMYTTAYAAGSPYNDTGWENEYFNKLLTAARAELDESRRQDMYGQMQRMVRDDGATIVPLFASYVSAHSDRLAHGPVAGNYDMDGFKLTERWWFES